MPVVGVDFNRTEGTINNIFLKEAYFGGGLRDKGENVMKNVAVIALLIGFVGSSAMGGTIDFGGDVTIDRGVDSPMVDFDLMITDFGAAAGYNAVDVIVGSDDGLAVSFAMNTPGVTQFFGGSAADTSVYASGWKFGYFGTTSPTPTAQLLGTLTVDTTGLAEGQYTVQINGDTDGGKSVLTAGVTTEPLIGSATITVVPEPATLALLGIGGLVTAMRRRRTA
jgi:PEP-CTERM motif